MTEISRYVSVMIERRSEIEALGKLLRRHPVVGLVGPRGVGKTTLAANFVGTIDKPASFFDLENPEDLARLADPMLALKDLKGLVVMDEIQRVPELFPVLRVLADRPMKQSSFLVVGSASPSLLATGSESLFGRIRYYRLNGLMIDEIGVANERKLWLRGGFPRSYLARSHAESDEWRCEFIGTFLERDLPQFGVNIRSTTLRRFWNMLAHFHGRVWNASEFARSLGVADTTVRNYLNLLTSTHVITQLPPWYENVSKRQVKAPKVYITDCGLLHSLLNLRTLKDLEGHPKLGASWEGFVLQHIIRRLGAKANECFFWATHAGAGLDLLVIRGRQRFGFETMRTCFPRITPSMRIAMVDLKLRRLDVIHAGDETFPMGERLRAVAFGRLQNDLDPLP